MSAINNGVMRAVRDRGFSALDNAVCDDLYSSVGASQSGATALSGALHRVTKGAATASFMLKAMLMEAPRIVIVVNDGPNSINVYPAVGDTMNGVANAAQAIAAGATGIFVHTKEAGVTDWRAGTVT